STERKIIARVEATGGGTDVRFIVTNLPGRAKHLYGRVYCARGRMENLIKEREALHQVRPHLLSSLGGQPVPAVPAHRGLLAVAHVARRHTQAFAPANSHLRDYQAGVPENRHTCRATQIAHPDCFANGLPAQADAHPADRPHQGAKPVTGAACAAGRAPDINLKRVSKSRSNHSRQPGR
ncbi:hypothetical protein MNBD_ALPHA09-2277, partial [hydrothermal vent metagenome]